MRNSCPSVAARPALPGRVPFIASSTAGTAGSVISAERDPAEPGPATAAHLQAVRLEFDAQARRFEQAKARLQAIVDQIEKGRPRQEILRTSEFARLQASLQSLPVIEQAKGILMAQQRCGPEEAFDLLRRASQRANVKVAVLAAQIVGQVTSPTTGTSAMPARPAASTHPGRARSPGAPAGAATMTPGPRSSRRRWGPGHGPGLTLAQRPQHDHRRNVKPQLRDSGAPGARTLTHGL